jgi:hypothetical protein
MTARMTPASKGQEIDMKREINLLSDNELDAVVGGRMNNGMGQYEKNPQYGVPGSTQGTNAPGFLAVEYRNVRLLLSFLI